MRIVFGTCVFLRLMANVSLFEFDKIATSLNDSLAKNDLESVQSLIDDAISSDSCTSWDLLEWLLRKVDDQSIEHSSELENLLMSNIFKLSKFHSTKELVVIFHGQLESSTSLRFLLFSLPYFRDCAISFGISDFANTHLIFQSIQVKLQSHIKETNLQEYSKLSKHLVDLLREISVLLLAIFPPDTHVKDALMYVPYILYYFSHVLYLIDVNKDTEPLFETFLSVLQVTSSGISSECFDLIFFSRICSDIDLYLPHFSDKNIALLHALGLCLTSNTLCSCWPTVYTKKYEVELFIYLSTPFVKKIEKSLSEGSFLCTLDVRRLIRTQEHLIFLSFKTKRCLPSSFWTSFPISLIKSFESISKRPISSKSLPTEIKNSVSVIESLLSISPITARCQLFSIVIERSINSFHCGMAAHMIVLFKNFLHETLLELQRVGREGLISLENEVGESKVTLPFDVDYLRGVCSQIYQYPLANCNDSIFDQYGWLMAALNMVIYVSIRVRSISEIENSNEEAKVIAHGIVQAFSRPDAKGRSTLKTRFLEPLASRIVSISNKYKLAEREYEKNPDPRDIPSNVPTLQECQLSLLRLRLLMDTVSRVGELFVT